MLPDIMILLPATIAFVIAVAGVFFIYGGKN